ncbi:hypothetical protein BOX15_Mlig030443g1 [Macrostomum lignano]|uniref:Uncharacterized protein n=2 Tax=Macrostomum lignano TaxID=282301 RepID=A0A267G9S1_9PLAT|nr:hypothetical protein BOX15_Mlig020646g1 [Macrostomum lignano]PAA82030.1 hypothetical protein BOX15_Mlig034099g1 [Macrostomum lignano]PAA82049.1 hypothetical protein BOX15_Mlig030443g1 [Macrostomum lignano]
MSNSGNRQELRGLSREISKLVAVSNPGPRFSALPSFSESDEESSNGASGGGGGGGGGSAGEADSVVARKKRRQRGAGRANFIAGGVGAGVNALSAPASMAGAGSGSGLMYQHQYSLQQLSMPGQSDCIYDSQGRIVANGQDACDCLTLGCPGCYFPCARCGGTKCGYECRVGRNSYVKQIKVESLGDLKICNRLIIDDEDRDK